jgi:DNA-binding NtrC family response regulator
MPPPPLPGATPSQTSLTASASVGGDALRLEIEAAERKHILEALTQCGGNQTRAAVMLGISRRTLVARLGDYNLPRPRKRAT